jgi:hypothetical protein
MSSAIRYAICHTPDHPQLRKVVSVDLTVVPLRDQQRARDVALPIRIDFSARPFEEVVVKHPVQP